MSIFKCKMCGGTLEINENQTTATCEYCGTEQTLPKLNDERKANLYDRANHFRRNKEFDKAMSIYENILNEDNTDAEAYWSIVLCHYGIEYVEDPTSHKRIPTVNRAQFTSIFDDDNYKSAIQYADMQQRAIYESEAKAINEIQKGILAIAQNEKPFDVFICYKETDENGRRTQDSVLANDLYHQLTAEGFKVFFSRITLEDKLGVAYEPYIFAALNSAKVMVVIGTKPEYFNAVWVKNEWSRYLTLVKQSAGKKILIPAYRGMDPYDLPEEFSHLQAQDMSKLGFMQDLIRGIKKLIQSDKPKAPKETVVVNTAVSNVAPLLKRAFMYLEDGDWKSADEYCEKVLDLDPENAEAYLGKLMAELHCCKKQDIKDLKDIFEENAHYEKIMRFGSPELKKELEGYNDYIEERNHQQYMLEIYEKACFEMQNAYSETNFRAAAEKFDKICEYKDSEEKKQYCLKKADEAHDAAIEEAKLKDYQQAVDAMKSATTEYLFKEAAKKFAQLNNYKDSKEKHDECLKKAQQCAENARKTSKIAIIAIASVLILLALFSIGNYINKNVIIPSNQYNAAVQLMESGKYDEAITTFEALNGYKDSNDKIKICWAKVLNIAEDEIIVSTSEETPALSISNSKIYISSSINTDKLLLPHVFDGEVVRSVSMSKDAQVAHLVISNTVTTIPQEAFESCYDLASITIPNSVIRIGEDAFKYAGIECVYISDIEAWYNISFSNTGLRADSVYLNGNLMTNLTIPNDITTIKSLAFAGFGSLKFITIPDSVTSIGSYAFSHCTSLTSITIPDSVTSIGDDAFYGCTRLTSITIPDSVTSIGDDAFRGCTSLTSIAIPDSVTNIGSGAFSSCKSLRRMIIPSAAVHLGTFFGGDNGTYVPLSLETIVISGGSYIDTAAFYNCRSLTSITIPDSVTSIGEWAFRNCTSLTSITFNGTVKQWGAISKGSKWNENTGNYTVYCTDGTVSR